MNNVVKCLILTGLMVMLGLWNDPVWATQVFVINNSTHDVGIDYGAYCYGDGLHVLLTPPDQPESRSFTVQAGKVFMDYPDEMFGCILDMYVYVYIGNEGKCKHDRGADEVQGMKYRSVRVTLEDAGDGLKCDFEFE